MIKKIFDWFLNKLFKTSTYPVLFRDLLEANALYNEGMLVDPAKLNFRIKILNIYIFYFILCLIIFVPLILITHYTFTKIDFHFSIISSIVGTSCVFILFDIFRIYIRKIISKRLILQAWKIHFPYFEYEKYSKKVEKIYKQALKQEVPKNALECYILEQIVKQD